MSISSQIRQSIISKLKRLRYRYLSQRMPSYGIALLADENDINYLTKVFLKGKSIRLQMVNLWESRDYSMMKYLFNRATPKTIASLVSNLGFTKLIDTIDVFYDLLWYINTFEDAFKPDLTSDEISYISGLTTNELLSLVPKQSLISIDSKALLLFSIVSGGLPSTLSYNPDRYPLIKQYPPNVIWKLYKVYRVFLSPSSPYEVVSNLDGTADKFFLYTNTDNINYLIDLYGIIFPVPLIDREVRVNEFLHDIIHYNNVFTRPSNIDYPRYITINQIDPRQDLQNALSYLIQLTTREILQAYKYEGKWDDRINLINEILGKLMPHWSWFHSYCQNDNTLNVEEGIAHGRINKNDTNNPTLSYGTIQHYRCYQIDELIYIFKESRNFNDPNYHRELTGFDPATGRLYSPTFSMETILELIDLLEGEIPLNYNHIKSQELLEIIYAIIIEQQTKLQILKTEYDSFDNNEKFLARLVIAWIFFYGIWQRFWKGPGRPWPYKPKNDINICIPLNRDEHVDIQNNIWALIKKKIRTDSTLNVWINKLPVINYDVNTGDFQILTDTVVQILPGYLTGTHCMGIGGDLFLGIGYILITELLDVDINEFISEMLPELLYLERQVVNYTQTELYPYIELINSGQEVDDNIRDKIMVLKERYNDLNKPVIIEKFDISNVRLNKHID